MLAPSSKRSRACLHPHLRVRAHGALDRGQELRTYHSGLVRDVPGLEIRLGLELRHLPASRRAFGNARPDLDPDVRLVRRDRRLRHAARVAATDLRV